MPIALLPGPSMRLSPRRLSRQRGPCCFRECRHFATRLPGQKELIIIATSRKKLKRVPGLRLKNHSSLTHGSTAGKRRKLDQIGRSADGADRRPRATQPAVKPPDPGFPPRPASSPRRTASPTPSVAPACAAKGNRHIRCPAACSSHRAPRERAERCAVSSISPSRRMP